MAARRTTGSEFGGSAWKCDSATGQYYYHAFLAEQPDLNWRNPRVRAAMYDVMRFWLRRGVDGFRVDVIWHLIKDDQFRDNPPNPAFTPGEPPHRAVSRSTPPIARRCTTSSPEMRRVLDEFRDRVLIGEIYLPVERLVTYYGRDLAVLHLPFNFPLIGAVAGPGHREADRDYEAALPPGGCRTGSSATTTSRASPAVSGRRRGRRHAAADAAWHADALLWRRDRNAAGDVSRRIACAIRSSSNVPGLGVGRDGCRTPMQWDADRQRRVFYRRALAPDSSEA